MTGASRRFHPHKNAHSCSRSCRFPGALYCMHSFQSARHTVCIYCPAYGFACPGQDLMHAMYGVTSSPPTMDIEYTSSAGHVTCSTQQTMCPADLSKPHVHPSTNKNPACVCCHAVAAAYNCTTTEGQICVSARWCQHSRTRQCCTSSLSGPLQGASRH